MATRKTIAWRLKIIFQIYKYFRKGILCLIITLLLLLFSCRDSKIELQIGSKIDSSEVKKYESEYFYTSSSSFEKIYTIRKKGITYKYSIDRNKYIIKAVFTFDAAFSTSEGVKIGSLYKDVKSKSHEILIKDPGWAYYIELPSGWYAVFIEGEKFNKEITDTSKVRYLFKR